MPQDFNLLVYSGLNTRSQAFSGMAMPPRAFSTLVLLMPTVVKPQAHGTRCLFSGSALVRVAMMAGSRLARLGIWSFFSGCSRPPSIWPLANTVPGTTMS
ncbi:hypothetical protein D9M69_712420 [compost metagenome]